MFHFIALAVYGWIDVWMDGWMSTKKFSSLGNLTPYFYIFLYSERRFVVSVTVMTSIS